MILTRGLDSITIAQPYYGYTVKVTPKISRTDTTGTKSISFYDYGASFDVWSLEVQTNVLSLSDQTAFEAFLNSDGNRGKPVVLSSIDGFYPCSPLYPLNSSYSVIFLPDKYGNGKQQDKPYLYWSSNYTAIVTAKPTASAVTYASDNGSIRIGTVENLRGLQYHAEPKTKQQFGYSTTFKTLASTGLPILDYTQSSDYQETKFELELSDLACAALVKYILIDRNIDDVEIQTGKNTFLFGVGYGASDGSGTYKVHILNEEFEFEHFEFNRWRVSILARLYEAI